MHTVNRLLALDTATQSVSAALYLDGRLVSKAQHEPNRHSECILPLVDALLKEAQVDPKSLDAIAFGAGPGAFTGLRVACGVAQGMAWALDKPVVPVSNLAATARAAFLQGVRGRILVALDARMNECYCGVYDATPGLPMEVVAASLVKPAMLAEVIAQAKPEVGVGSGFAAYEEARSAAGALPLKESIGADAAVIADCAVLLAREGKTVAPEAAAPFYVRNRVALTIEERARGERLPQGKPSV